MTTLLEENFDRLLQRQHGIEGDLPRIRNYTKSKDVYGYLDPKESEKLFKSTYFMRGFFSSKEVWVANGDLIYDRHHEKYGYVTQLIRKEYGYEAMVYMCNSIITIAHPDKFEDSYKQKIINWDTTVHHRDMRALISLEDVLKIESNVGSILDRTIYYCYLQYSSTVHQGDRIYDGTKYYIVKNIDDMSFNGALKCLEMGITNA